MPREIDLDEVTISPATLVAWHGVAQRLALALRELKRLGREIPEIPIERGRVEDDGTLTVYIDLPGLISASISVPRDQWKWADSRRNM